MKMREAVKNYKPVRTLQLLKRLQDPRCPKFGGHEYAGRGRGMGRLILNVTAYAITRNGKVVISNGAY